MHFVRPLLHKSPLNWIVLIAALTTFAPRLAHAEAHLLIEADSGKVLEAENATIPWYPASVTKMMTAYVTLKAVKDGKITLDTLLTVSPTAASQSPSKMGFRPGTQVTVDNALKMMLVKSANDMAVVLAEGVGGSIDGFSAMMNDSAQKLGMTQTHFANFDGLPWPTPEATYSSPRDLIIMGEAAMKIADFRKIVGQRSHSIAATGQHHHYYWANTDLLLGRYRGAVGIKTGYTTAAGYCLLFEAKLGGKELMGVVLDSTSTDAAVRFTAAARLLNWGFTGS